MFQRPTNPKTPTNQGTDESLKTEVKNAASIYVILWLNLQGKWRKLKYMNIDAAIKETVIKI